MSGSGRKAVNPFATTRKSAAIWGVNSKGAAKATKRAGRLLDGILHYAMPERINA